MPLEFRLTANSPASNAATRDCSVLLGLLIALAGVFGFPAVVVGSFVGPHILFTGLGLLAFAGVLALTIFGLERRSPVACWVLRVGAVAVAAIGISGLIAALGEPGGAAAWGGIGLVGLVLLGRSWWLPTGPRE